MREGRIGAWRRGVLLVVAGWLALPASAEDLYRRPVCLGMHGEEVVDPDTVRLKLLRWPYAIEQPFHVLPERAFEKKQKIDRAIRVLYHGHSGVVLEGPTSADWNADVQLQAGFNRGPVPGSPLCQDDAGFAVPEARITTDPFTGNLFVGRFDLDRLHLAVFDPAGNLLLEIRSDLFFRGPLSDLTGTPRAKIDPETTPDYAWFAPENLAGFVERYRRIGGAAYARYIVDSFLSELIYRDRTTEERSSGPRLPFLPGPGDAPESLTPGSVDNLRGLRTTYRQGFIRGKPRKGGVSCALMPVLKMLEDRDCREEAKDGPEQPIAANSCPTYSAMALQTELFREHPDSTRHRGYAVHQVFETLVRHGLCSEGRYPMLTDVAVGPTRSVEQFGSRAEEELNRILGAPETDAPEGFQEFLAGTPAGELRFEEQLPPLCRQEMDLYRERHPLADRDLVDLLVTQKWFDDALPKEATAELLLAQKDELYRLAVRLLRKGLLVGVAGDRGRLEQHAVLAYGWDEGGFLLMDSDLPSEAVRRRTVMPAKELRRTIVNLTFLRDEVEGVRPSARQLSASLAVLPDVAWTHVRLAELYQEQDRYRDAAVHLRRAVELDPTRANGWLSLGETLQVLGRFEEALEATRTAMELGLDGRFAKAQLGYSLRKLGRLEEAERELRAAVNQEYSWEWRQLGWTLFDLGKDAEAEECFHKALEIEPGWIWNHVQLGEFLAYAGRREEAAETLLAAARGDFDPSDLAWVGNWLAFLERHDEAVPLLESVLAREPDNHAARLALARIHHRQGASEAVAAVVAPLLAIDASDSRARIDLAYAQALAGSAAACRETVADLKARFPEMEGDVLYDVSCIQALNGDEKHALDTLEVAFQRGFDDYRWARRDPDLSSLAGTPRLKHLFETYGPHER